MGSPDWCSARLHAAPGQYVPLSEAPRGAGCGGSLVVFMNPLEFSWACDGGAALASLPLGAAARSAAFGPAPHPLV